MNKIEKPLLVYRNMLSCERFLQILEVDLLAPVLLWLFGQENCSLKGDLKQCFGQARDQFLKIKVKHRAQLISGKLLNCTGEDWREIRPSRNGDWQFREVKWVISNHTARQSWTGDWFPKWSPHLLFWVYVCLTPPPPAPNKNYTAASKLTSSRVRQIPALFNPLSHLRK